MTQNELNGRKRKRRALGLRRWRVSMANADMLEPLEPRLLLSAATVNWATLKQTISGFGASSAWMSGTFTGSQQQLLWSTTNGAGLSILRSKIDETSNVNAPTSGETSIMQEAQAMGVTIFSTPWSMPAQFKSNNSIDNGGTLLPADYQAYASWLAAYVINMKNTYGITLYAVSMQNEPDWTASYDSSLWTAAEFDTVLFQYLEPTFTADGLTTKIILPEETHWDSLGLVSTVLSDPQLANYSNIIFADHTYGDYSNNSPITGLGGNPIWETEHTGDNPSIGVQAALDLAENIYHVVGQNQASAYNYWWINSGGGAGLLGGNWQSTYNFTAMENFSKFIRPGWMQIGETDDNSGLQISAFKDPNSGNFATVLINNTSAPITETISLNGAYSPVITPWLTSATLSVAQQQSIPATGNGGSYTYTIPAKSIVTLTGTATTTPVAQAPVGLLATAATTSSITLSWTSNLASAPGYTVQRSSDGTNWTTLTNSLSSSTYAYTDSSMPANSFTTTYYYRVQANNGTLFSNVVAAMTQPPAPTNLKATYSTSTLNVTLNWTGDGSSSVNYAVDVSTDGGLTWTTQNAGLSSNATSYTDTSAPELATLQYRVRAIYGLNSSAAATATVTTTVLKAPTGLAITAGGSSAVLAWNDNTTTNSTVSIERSTDGTNWTVIGSVSHGVQTYTDSTVAQGGTYYYRIRNYDSAATPPTYSAYDTASPITIPPAAPTHVEVEFSPLPTLMARVLWVDNATGETAYEVDRSADGGTTWTTLSNTLPAGSTTYTDTTLTSGQAYEYRVKALNNSVASAAVATLSETASALPAPYSHGDIGDAATVGLAGSASFNSTTSTFTLTGAGADIWNTADGFQFAFTTLTGDGSFITQVASMANFATSGKAGIMMRSSLDPNSAYAIAFLTPQGTINFEERLSSGASAASRANQGTFSTPEWLKLTRSGNSFSVYYGTNGTTWTQLGSAFSITMGSTIYVGLITSAHSSTQLATATFTGAALTGTGNQRPTVATAAAANPSPATRATANLTVLGADDAGEGNLIYTWATTGTPPAAVVFSSNGQNGSKNIVATFTQPGSYSFLVTITDQFELSTTSAVSLTVVQTLASVIVSPSGATVAPNSQKQFSLIAYDQFGTLVSNPSGIVWSTSGSGLGSISASGLYSAGSLQGLTTITATAGSVSGSATVNVTTLPAPLVWYQADVSGSTLIDSSGNGKTAIITGTLNTNYNFTSGIEGSALHLINSGTPAAEYATLPTGIVSGLNDFTISTWIKIDSQNLWARVFDLGTGTNTYMHLVPMANSAGGPLVFGITTSGYQNEQQLVGPVLTAGIWYQIAVTLVGNTGTLYVNGAAVASNTGMTLHPAALGNTTQNYLGKSQFGDPGFQGSIDEFRLFGSGLSAPQITQLYNSYFPPTVATPAAANPAIVTAVTSTLSTLGASNLGESALKYSWAVIGTPPAPVTFSINGTNAAKSTVANFSKAGTYTLGVTMADTYGQFAASTVTVTVNQTLAAILISPGSSALNELGTQVLTATAYDQFGAALPTQPNFTWSISNGGGSQTPGAGIHATTTYTAPQTSTTATLQALSGAITATATVTVTNLPPSIAAAAVSTPPTTIGTTANLSVLGADLGGESNLIYTWATTGTPPAGVSFSANGSNVSKNTTVTFTKAGTYNFQLTVKDAGNLTATSNVQVIVAQTPTSLGAGGPVSLYNSQSDSMSASVLDQFGDFIESPSVTWSIDSGPGSLIGSTFTAPYSGPGTTFIRATAGAATNTTQITTNLSRISALASNDTIRLAKSTDNLDVYINSSLVYSAALASLNTLTITTLGDSGAVIFDFSSGNPLPSGPITMDGAGGTSIQVLGAAAPFALTLANGAFISAAPLALTALSLSNNATLTLQPGGGNQLAVTSIALAPGSAIDLNDNTMAVLTTAPQSTLSAVEQQLALGRNGGDWAGTGIRSTAANTGYLAYGNVEYNGLAVAINGTLPTPRATIAGQALDMNSVIITYTIAGDADLSGSLNSDDFLAADDGYLMHRVSYGDGDFDYSGTVDAADFAILNRNIQGPPQMPSIAISPAPQITPTVPVVVAAPLVQATASPAPVESTTPPASTTFASAVPTASTLPAAPPETIAIAPLHRPLTLAWPIKLNFSLISTDSSDDIRPQFVVRRIPPLVIQPSPIQSTRIQKL